MTAAPSNTVTVHHGDSREVLKGFADNSIDSVVCDPPYALESIAKRFGKTGAAPSKVGATGAFARASAGFMGQKWDTGETAFDPEFWAEVLRVLKPGGYVVAFSGARTGHWQACAMELAGFIMHPFLAWLFASGFPKAHSAAKAIDKHLGTPGTVAAKGAPVRRIRPGADQHRDGSWEKLEGREYQPGTYVPGSAEAETWAGWAYGAQTLKPAMEPIYMAQKPFDQRNGAANILAHGTGAVNIDACRVPVLDDAYARNCSGDRGHGGTRDRDAIGVTDLRQGGGQAASGRWPANVIHDGSDEVAEAFPAAPGQRGDVTGQEPSAAIANVYNPRQRTGSTMRGDQGSAARFFYSAKADAEDRLGSDHPTVKPVDLMAWLCRLVTPPGGVVLDPFAGTGTTGLAALLEGFDCILIERQEGYVADIRRRLAWARGEGRLTVLEKARDDDLEKADGRDLPLFKAGAA